MVAINLLNTDNEADRRVYDILSKKFELFEGVFGASDVALGALVSGVSFEKRILNIYQNCKNITAVRKAFAALNRQLDAKKNLEIADPSEPFFLFYDDMDAYSEVVKRLWHY